MDFAKAMELDPFWPDPYVARGQLLDRQGDEEAANRDFRRAFELGYQSEWLTQRVQSIGG
jgi:Flp pilus assembly protein TadD